LTHRFNITIDQEALKDIQEATDWYNKQVKGLGSRFQKQVKVSIGSLKENPVKYSVRYQAVRCVLVKKFPFLIHFTIDENKKIIEIFAVIHTSRNPTIWEERAK
jgi:mRNA-degrading endonuclease RelE of RelBE toxin-antitoxin system